MIFAKCLAIIYQSYLGTDRSGDVCERYQRQRKISGTATGHNGDPRSVKLNSWLYSELSLTHMETYRSGHNGADSKSVCGQPHVGSNPTVSAKKRHTLL